MITAQRAIVLLTGAALALSATPSAAQVDPGIVLNIMRECAKIDDPTARLACYDNNVRAGGAVGAIPGQMPRPSGGGAVANPNAPSGFGADDLRTQSQERFNPTRNGAKEISTTVADARERQPGVYLVTLSSGAQWLFSEGVSQTYRPPRRGDSVRIERGALGSYLMMVGKQAGVKVTRIK
uniref:hypothetical protein n=1 Tax=Altererythrobacter segetis TaxID=1104773 RepID=UPI001407D8EB|nr:hypothetical protein [Altererythrobacter segetis]